jgi:hypothetical protein
VPDKFAKRSSCRNRALLSKRSAALAAQQTLSIWRKGGIKIDISPIRYIGSGYALLEVNCFVAMEASVRSLAECFDGNVEVNGTGGRAVRSNA